MMTLALSEAYLNHLTDNGRKFFERFVSEVHNTQLNDQLELRDANGQVQFVIAFDPLIQQWYVKSPSTERMFLVEFAAFIGECSFHQAFWLIRSIIYPPAVQSTNWKSAIELAKDLQPDLKFSHLA